MKFHLVEDLANKEAPSPTTSKMGGGSRQPFIYEAPKDYDARDPYGGFNPKAVSQAALALPRPSKAKSDGPLVNFNQHPDTYGVPAYKKSESPLHPDTAKRMVLAKRMQLVFRFSQLLAIVGIAVCVISVQGTTDVQSWIVRLPVSLL
jgi:hypothetical protein